MKKYLFFLAIGLFIFTSPVLAHIAEGVSLVETVARTSFFLVKVGGFLILLLILTTIFNKNSSNIFKTTIFFLIVFISLFITFYLVGVTVYLNINSVTGGPVHWHADYRIFDCGKEVVIIKPSGFSNRVGRTDLHEHGDKRIHVEGVVVEKQDVSLHEFFKVIGGTLGYGELAFPGNEKFEWLTDGNKCSDGREGKLQVFLYKSEGKIIKQNKLTEYPDYVLSGESQIPPGDCIIFEFSPDIKEKTELMCDFTSIAIQKGEFNYIK